MNNKLILSLCTTTILGVGMQASLADIEGLTSEKIDCDNGLKGFNLEIKKDEMNKTVNFNSCIDKRIVVRDLDGNTVPEEESESGDRVTIDGVEYYFPNGYTETNAAVTTPCLLSYVTYQGEDKRNIECQTGNVGTEVKEEWLNLVSVSGYLTLSDASVSNVDNLKNLTVVNGDLMLPAMNNRKGFNIDGLHNLQRVGKVLSLHSNNLTNVDGLSELTSVGGTLTLAHNKLTDLNGLRSLKEVAHAVNINGNPDLNDISGLNNFTYVKNNIIFDNINPEVKLKADAWLCNEGFEKILISDFTTPVKSKFCEE